MEPAAPASTGPVIGALFSGYGGLDLAVGSVLGGRVAWHVEYDKAPSKILDHHYPDIPNHGDVTGIDWSAVEPVDVLTGGYPCQPFSHAGLRKGTRDERHLWPYVLQAIGALEPRLVVLENVRGHLSLGFDTVLADLAGIGWSAEWGIVRASDAGACHQRARLFIVCRPDSSDTDPWQEWTGPREAEPSLPGPADATESVDAPDAVEWGDYGPAIRRWEQVTGRPAPAPTEPGRTGNPRLSPAFVEWMMGLEPGWVTDPDIGISRNEQLKALGNGVVPAQAALALSLLLPRLGQP